MEITQAAPSDVAEASRSLADAFSKDPLINYLFKTHPQSTHQGAQDFFGLLLRVRIELAMPALVLKERGKVLGAAMGYTTTAPKWPARLESEWAQRRSKIPGIDGRFDAYGQIADRYQPKEPHYYLGVLGVHPEAQGIGAGKQLLSAFCQLSAADPASSGVYLETASPDSLRFYYRNGFILCGQGEIEDWPIWCVFWPNPK